MKSKVITLFAFILMLSLLLTACAQETEVPPTGPPEDITETETQEDMAETETQEDMAETETQEDIAETETQEDMAETTEIDCYGGEDDEVSLLAVWSGDEEARLIEIFQPLIDACGITFAYEGTRDLSAVLATRVEGGNPPDITMMPSIGSLTQYRDSLVPLDQVGAHLENYSPSWIGLGSIDGVPYGVFVKSDIKSTVWYSPVEFEANGYEVPTTWEEFVALVDQIKMAGGVPLSMGMGSGPATGWPGTDFVQDIMLITQGLAFTNGLVFHDTTWNDPGMKEVWEMYGNWAMDDSTALGGAKGTVSTGFIDAIYAVFSDPPQAFMVKQSGFSGGVVERQYPELEYGTDYAFFVLPGIGGDPSPMQVGGDALAVFSDKPAVKAVVDYLTSEIGAKAWAASGFDLSPNMKATRDSYTDPISADKADALLAAPAVSFDIGDLLLGGLNLDEFEAITEYVNGGDLDAILDRLEDRAEEIYGGTAAIDCMGAEGTEISLLAVWSGDEEARLIEIFQPLIDACGITFAYEGTRDLSAVLATRVEGGKPPDLTMMPGIGSMEKYKDSLIPMKDMGAHLENYDQSWLKLGSVDGTVYGIPVKSDIKGTVWYSPVEFEAAGYTVPVTWEEFVALVDQIKADGAVPLSMGMESGAATGWTGSDFIQDIMLRAQGKEFTEGLAVCTTAWNDPGVASSWETYGNWAMDDTYALAGSDGTVSTGFIDAIYAVFSDPPQAYMVKQSGFSGGIVESQYPELVFGTDFDFFVLPSEDGSPPIMQVGGDFLAAFNGDPSVKAVVAYLTSGRGGRAWAASGFDLSPNNMVTGLSYGDPISSKKASVLLQSPSVSFDVGDLLKGGLTLDEFDALTEYVNGGDLTTLLNRMEARAQEICDE